MQLSARLQDIDSIASQVLQAAGDHTIIEFHGNLGAGKTTLIQAICRQLGITDEVSSPTFSIVNEYRSASGNPVYHFDCYRLKTPEEAYDIGIEEYLASGHICLIEWPENLGDILPPHTFSISITADGADNRTYTLTGF